MDQGPLVPVHEILARLAGTIPAVVPVPQGAPAMPTRQHPGGRVDVVVAPNEICFAHGTGVLLARLLAGAAPYITLRSWNNWGGEQSVAPLADHVFQSEWPGAKDRTGAAAFATEVVDGFEVGHILAVPYFRHDVHMALAAKAATGAPMTVYVMDDNTLFNAEIPQEEMGELLRGADAVFAISPEMRTLYQNHFRVPILVAPPVVADDLVRARPSDPPVPGVRARVGLIGNIWHQAWLDQMMDSARRADITVEWLASAEEFHWLTLPDEDLRSGRLVFRPGLPSRAMLSEIEQFAAVIVPSGTFEETGHALSISRLSLPSRMSFIVAGAGTPLLVLGHSDTGAARFVRRFDLGLVSPYEPQALADALTRLRDPSLQARIRRRASELGPIFRAGGVLDLLRGTAQSGGVPTTDRFERIFGLPDREFGYYLQPAVPRLVFADHVDTFRAFTRLRAAGYRPDFVVDVGASSGIWSYYAWEVFPEARFLLIDPLASRYTGRCHRDGFEILECAVCDHEGTAEFRVSADLYNSSLIAVGSVSAQTDLVRVPMRTLDSLAAEHDLKGRGILKLDVQFSEHLALAGAQRLLGSVDVVIVEANLIKQTPDMMDLRALLEFMTGAGFDWFDEVGEWRNPQTGRLEQKDVLFLRRGAVVS